MRLRAYIAIVILTFIGVLTQGESNTPNQEIVLQFHDVAIHSDHAQHTIAHVKAQLEGIGVANIQVNSLHDGTLKILYYSNKTLDVVKKYFSEDDTFGINISSHSKQRSNSQLPLGEEYLSFQFDIFEIQKYSDSQGDLNGVNTAILKLKTDHLFDPNKQFIAGDSVNPTRGDFDKISLKTSGFVALLLRHYPQKTPQVRAGPWC